MTLQFRPVVALRSLAPLLALAILGGAGTAFAQAWQAKQPIKMLVSFPPGGVADVIARLVAPPLGEAVGQTVVVENRPGANGNIAGEAVVKSPADGYTLLMSAGGLTSMNQFLYNKLAFDPVKDLQPVAATARVVVFLVTRPEIPANNVAEFIAHARANPGKLTYGTPGNGSSPHIAGEMFKRAARVDIVHVPYKGAAPAMTDLLGGQLAFMFDPGIGLQHVRSGKLRLLAVGSPRRSALFPDTPTLAEAGMEGYDADSWFGIYAPAAVPADVVVRLNREINRILQTPAVRERIAALGSEAAPMSPAEFNDKLRVDRERFGALIREVGMKAE